MKKPRTKPNKTKQITGELFKCNQKHCAYNVNGGCKPCEECGAEPNKVNDRCMKCWNCENKEGELRWEDTNKNKETEEEKEKDIPCIVGYVG